MGCSMQRQLKAALSPGIHEVGKHAVNIGVTGSYSNGNLLRGDV